VRFGKCVTEEREREREGGREEWVVGGEDSDGSGGNGGH